MINNKPKEKQRKQERKTGTAAYTDVDNSTQELLQASVEIASNVMLDTAASMADTSSSYCDSNGS